MARGRSYIHKGQSVSRLERRLVQFLQRDEIRTTTQTVVAVLLSFAAMELLPLDTLSWAVFSALFVVQANIGGTIGLALWRVAGALVGAAVAVLLILFTGQEDRTFTVLAIGVAIMSGLSIRWPSLSYGLVTVAIIAVTPDFNLIEETFEKVAAITIGSCSAILACMIVLPVSAHRSATNQLAEALRLSGKYISDCMGCVIDGETRETEQQQTKALNALQKASLMWEQARIEKTPARFGRRLQPIMSEALLKEAHQLGERLALADQFSKNLPASKLDQAQTEVIRELSLSIHEQLNSLGDAVSHSRNQADPSTAWKHYHHFCEIVENLNGKPLSEEQREYFMVLKWACHSIITSIETLARHVEDAHRKLNPASRP